MGCIEALDADSMQFWQTNRRKPGSGERDDLCAAGGDGLIQAILSEPAGSLLIRSVLVSCLPRFLDPHLMNESNRNKEEYERARERNPFCKREGHRQMREDVGVPCRTGARHQG